LLYAPLGLRCCLLQADTPQAAGSSPSLSDSDSEDEGLDYVAPRTSLLMGLLLYTISTMFGATTSVIVKLLGGESNWGPACRAGAPRYRVPQLPRHVQGAARAWQRKYH